ncbi:MAG: hypothetical protein ACOYMN_19535, partial [Roseimicrobium sp.]
MRPSARFAVHRTLILRLVWLGLALALPTGCRQQPETTAPSEHKGARIHILADHFATPIRNYQIFLLEKLVKSRPFMTLVKYNAGGDVARQAQQVQASVQDHADYLVVFPVNAEKLAPTLRQALAR